jgi:hypothetical protein
VYHLQHILLLAIGLLILWRESFQPIVVNGCARYYRTTVQVNTPFNNPSVEETTEVKVTGQGSTSFNNPPPKEVTEVEVTDPTHPLFGRRFPVKSISSPPNDMGHVYVTYREYMVLRIPKEATNLVPARSISKTKLTVSAVKEFISLAEQCEGLCQSNPKTSSTDCRKKSKPKSATNCQKSSRR